MEVIRTVRVSITQKLEPQSLHGAIIGLTTIVRQLERYKDEGFELEKFLINDGYISFDLQSKKTEADEPRPVPAIQAHEQLQELLKKPVSELDFSIRTYNCMKNGEITTIRQLVSKKPAELLRVTNFGRRCLHEVERVLAGLGLQLGMDLDALDPLERSIESLGLPTLTENALIRNAGITTVRELVKKRDSELDGVRGVKNLGRGGLIKIKAALNELGLSLGMVDVDKYYPKR